MTSLPASMVLTLMSQMRDVATNAGLACDIPGCTKFTLGFSCVVCARKLCNGHGYWQMDTRGPPAAKCPYCVVESHSDLWAR